VSLEVTQEMLQAAVTEAVKHKLIPKYAFLDDYEATWGAVKAIVRAALEVRYSNGEID
jgi:hypothetical protein